MASFYFAPFGPSVLMPAHKYEHFMATMQYAIQLIHAILNSLTYIYNAFIKRLSHVDTGVIQANDKLDKILNEMKELRKENTQLRKELDDLKIGIWWFAEAHTAMMERHGDWVDAILDNLDK